MLSALLVPLELLYRGAVRARGWAYDCRLFRSEAAPIPTLTVGNLTVGGTGKTPITAWFARQLASLGHAPAVVMRGYGGDEVSVHQMLNPGVPVYVNRDRIAGVREAQRAGARAVVLDDAFQHRAILAHASLALIAAEDGVHSPRLLPRGPWREPLAALSRATLVVTTRKSASRAAADGVASRISELAPGLPQAQAHLCLAGLARYNVRARELGELRTLSGFQCRIALAGVAKPETFLTQLSEAGVQVEMWRAFPDHHRYRRSEVERIRRDAADGPLVMTLKDAVKLGAALGGSVDIHVPVQEVVWERGGEEIECLLANLLNPREEGGTE
jgi:tetraacyldisaccharide 4'-kinase